MKKLEIYDDIAARSGFSDTIVRAVLRAAQESAIESIKHCERFALPGLCIFNPSKEMYYENGKMVYKLAAKTTTADSLRTNLKQYGEFERREGEEDAVADDGIQVVPISSLF